MSNTKALGTRLDILINEKSIFEDLLRESKERKGAIIMSKDGSYEFFEEDRLKNPPPEIKKDHDTDTYKTLYDKALNVSDGKYDSLRHLILFFRGPSGIRSKSKTRLHKEIRGLWIKPQAKSLKLIDLDEAQGKIISLAYED